MERECANPRCLQRLSEKIPKNIIYCGYCQRKLRKLVLLFPDAKLHDITFLLEHGWANLIRVASLLGLERRTVMNYRKKGLIRFEQKGKYALATMEDLLRFARWRKRLITMFQAARIMRISYDTLKTLVQSKIIKPDFKSSNRLRLFDKTKLRGKRRTIEEWQRQKQTRKIASAQTKKFQFALTTRQMAAILKISLNGLWYQMRQNRLRVFRRGKNVYATKKNFERFCQLVAEGQVRTQGYTKKQAQNYLDSIAAG